MFVAAAMLLFGTRETPQILFGMLIEVIFISFLALSQMLRGIEASGLMLGAIATLDIVVLMVIKARYARSAEAEEQARKMLIEEDRDLFGDRARAERFNAEIVASLDGIDPGPVHASPPAELSPGSDAPLTTDEAREKEEIVRRLRERMPRQLD